MMQAELPFATALAVALRSFDMGARQTGRTNKMLAACKPGHRIVTATGREQHRLQGLIRERFPRPDEIEVIWLNPTWDFDRMLNEERSFRQPKPTVFDHLFLLGYWEARLSAAQSDLDSLAGLVQGVERGLPAWPETTPPDRGVTGKIER